MHQRQEPADGAQLRADRRPQLLAFVIRVLDEHIAMREQTETQSAKQTHREQVANYPLHLFAGCGAPPEQGHKGCVQPAAARWGGADGARGSVSSDPKAFPKHCSFLNFMCAEAQAIQFSIDNGALRIHFLTIKP